MKKLIMVFSLFIVIGVMNTYGQQKYEGLTFPMGTWIVSDKAPESLFGSGAKRAKTCEIVGANKQDVKLVIGKTERIFKVDLKNTSYDDDGFYAYYWDNGDLLAVTWLTKYNKYILSYNGDNGAEVISQQKLE